MATENLTTAEGWAAFLARHGGEAGPAVQGDTRDDSGRLITDPNKVFWTYTMRDGSTITINPGGQIKAIEEKGPSTATGTAAPSVSNPQQQNYTVSNPDGSTDTYLYRRDRPDQAWQLDTTFPVEHKPAPAGQKPPSDPSKWTQIRANPADPTSKVIALQDPVTGDRVAIPADAQPAKPSTFTGADGATYSWDGTTATKLIDAKPDKPQLIQGQNGAVYTYDGRSLSTLQAPSVTEGQKRTRIDPATNKTITETYSGGSWVPTEVVGGAKEGDTRSIVEGGYHVTQTYTGGEWKTTDVGARATPSPPVQATAGTESPFRSIYNPDTGQYTDQPNPNFAPKTTADVAGQWNRLQAQAAAKQQEFSSKISQTYSQDQARSDYQQWWAQNVEPQKQYLLAAQHQAQLAEQNAQEERNRQNLATAQTAGQNAASRAQAMIPYMVGPGFNQALNQIASAWGSGKPVGNVDLASAVTFQGPDLNQIAQQATNQALAHISPTAAQGVGQQQPALAGMNQQDMFNQLNQLNFQPTGGGVAAPPQAIPAPAPITSLGPNPPTPPAPASWSQAAPNFGAIPTTMMAPANPWATTPQPAPNFGAIPTVWPNYQYGG